MYGADNRLCDGLKATKYFDATRQRLDRSMIERAWIEVVANPQAEHAQTDGRIRRSAAINECGGHWL
jgi:hypothetical protein